MDKFLTVPEVAERLGAGPSTVRQWAKRGLFPNAIHVGRTGKGAIWLVPESDLESFERPKMGYPKGRPRKTAEPASAQAQAPEGGKGEQ